MTAPMPGGTSRLRRGSREGAAARCASLGDGGAGAVERLLFGFGELDRVLGGGLVPGTLVLLGGAPGVGKSTLLLQAAARLQAGGARTLYVSGEESREQVALRARRLSEETGAVNFLAATRVEEILAAALAHRPDLVCVDSVQTLVSEELRSPAGGTSQVRACASALGEFAKRTGAAVVLVGHVTKGGALAGPRTLEHLVDAVLYFGGQRSIGLRLLRASKNRFGDVEEIAVFRMGPQGLDPVADPSLLFLSDLTAGVSGSAVAVPLQGSRPLPAEVQALTSRARFSTPQRVSTGFSSRRLALLLAVLERRGGLALADKDVFVNVVGGLRLADPAADLAVLAALTSAELDRPLPPGLAFIGEVGLGGELRGVTHAEARVRAARKANLSGAVLPEALRADAGEVPGARWMGHVRDLVRMLREA